MLCKSLSDLREYIMEAGLHTPPEKIKASLFVTEMTYTPPSKKDDNKATNLVAIKETITSAVA